MEESVCSASSMSDKDGIRRSEWSEWRSEWSAWSAWSAWSEWRSEWNEGGVMTTGWRSE